MPGAFAYLGEDPRRVADGLARWFQPFPWIRASVHVDDGAVLATFHLEDGLANDVAVDRDRCAFVHGHAFCGDRLLHRGRDAEAAWEAEGGAYVVGILDRRDGSFRLRTDRCGLASCYVHEAPEGLYVSTRADAIAGLALARPAADADAALDVLTCGYVLGEATRHHGVRLLRPGAELVHRSGRTTVRAHWRPEFRPVEETVEARADALHAALARAMRRLDAFPGRANATLGLTGGLDSRTIYALAEPRPAAFTFGPEGSADRVHARAVAARLGGDHREFAIASEDVARGFDEAYRLADGMVAAVPVHLVGVARRLRAEGRRLLLDTYLGDALLGGSYFSSPKRSLPAAARALAAGASETPLDAASRRAAMDGLVAGWKADTPEPVRAALGDVVDRHLRRRAEEVFALADARFATPPTAEDLVDLVQLFLARGRRSIRVPTAITQHYVDVVSPMWDHEVVDEVMRTPARQRSWRRVYKRMHARHFPAVADVPCTSLDGATVRVSDRGRVARAYLRASFRAAGLRRPSAPVVDPQRWLREQPDFRAFVLDRVGSVGDWGTVVRAAALRSR